MEINTLAIIMTDTCNASCRMCCFHCSPQQKQVISQELILDYIDQASRIGTIRNISFSGGEAILYFDQLKECMAHAKELGMSSTLVTNGFWAADYEKGYRMISELAEAGLNEISFSVDQFHQEFVSIETVRNGIKICRSLGMLPNITLADLKDGKSSFHSIEKLRPDIYGSNLIVYPIFPAGAAVDHIPEEQLLQLCRKESQKCPFDNSIVLFFDGTILMCCSQFSRNIPLTKLGTMGETSLSEAIERLKKDDFLYLLFYYGFDWFVELAEKELKMQLDEYYSISCHLCQKLFGDEENVHRMEPFVKKEAARIRVERLFGR